MHQLIFDEEAIESLQGLPKELRKRIYDKIHSTKENPRRFFERLAGREDYKLRIGDHRAIADIDDSKKIIQITAIGHRKKIYEKS